MGNAWLQNLRGIRNEGPIDLVCLTGDVANTGRAEEYAEAEHFVRELMGTLELPMSPSSACLGITTSIAGSMHCSQSCGTATGSPPGR